MDTISKDLFISLPEITVLGMAMFILILDLFLNKNNRPIIYGLAQFTLFAAAYLVWDSHTLSIEHAYSDMFIDDPLSDVLKLGTLIGSSIMLVYTRQYMFVRKLFTGEYYALLLFAIVGMMVMISGQSMLTIYMGLELLSLCVYALVAIDRDNPKATEAAMKYFVLGALASGMLLYGMSMIYGVTGSLDLATISAGLSQTQIDNPEIVHNPVLILGLVFIVSGLAFKFGAVPFHMWVPDVYQGSPTAITILIGSVPKFAGFAMAIRLLVLGLYPLVVDWQGMLLIMAILSIAIGNITAIAQTNLKRMLAYSTISHIGFLLLGLMSGSLNGFASSMFYISAYVLMSLAGFGMILVLSRKGHEADLLDDLKGLNKRSPWTAFLMLITMFSMAGVPPTIGFYAKFTVLQAALQAGFVWIVVFAVLMAVIGAFYYLRIIKLMYFDEPTDTALIDAPLDARIVLSINALALLFLGLMPQGLMALSANAIFTSLQ
jgi:NADH-quinone oxidoreductase subunit N